MDNLPFISDAYVIQFIIEHLANKGLDSADKMKKGGVEFASLFS